MFQTKGAATRSLAQIGPGERVCIDRILYGILREVCAGAGLHEGDSVVCRRAAGAHIVLQSEERPGILIEQEWARFISVRSCESASDA
jgi:hypothetical protein